MKLIKEMRIWVLIALSLVLGLPGLQAGSVGFSSQTGNYFSFQNLTEVAPNIPPSSSNLQAPSLFTNPRDTIRFEPSAFVAVESQLGSLETATLTSTLSFLVQATAALPMEKLFIDLTGTYAEHPLTFPGAGTPSLSTSLTLDPIRIKIGGETKTWNPPLNVLRNTNDQTWSGSLEISKADLRALFNAPTMDVTQFEIQSVATVSATAQWGNASSYLKTLSFGIEPIPEPSVSSLVLLSALALLRKRRQISG